MSGGISIPELLKKKRNLDELTSEEINFFIQNVVSGNIQDCQTGKILCIEFECTVKAERDMELKFKI
jgi:thymidine phosphorylase